MSSDLEAEVFAIGEGEEKESQIHDDSRKRLNSPCLALFIYFIILYRSKNLFTNINSICFVNVYVRGILDFSKSNTNITILAMEGFYMKCSSLGIIGPARLNNQKARTIIS